jgi:hypothetical protein
MSEFEVEALVAGGFVVLVVIAIAVRLRWQLEHPERRRSPPR